MKKILFLFLSIALSSLSYAQETRIDEPTKEVCNKVILNIYNEIFKSKDKYPELSAFSQNALYENKYGVYTISYQFNDPDKKTTQPYEFLITIVGLDDKPYKQAGFEDKHYGFPVLNLRTSSYIRRDRRFYRYDIDKSIRKYNDLLYYYQQKFLPLQVTLRSDKDTFKVGERIEFEVTVKNISNENYRVKSLGKESLFFTIDDQEWGTKSDSQSSAQEVVIAPGNSIKRTFKGDSFSSAREVEIFSTYNVSFKGILPFGKLKVKIIVE